MRPRTTLACAAALVALARPASACAVCAASDPTLNAPGAERPFARRLRVGVDALVGSVREATPDGRLLTVDDRRVAATVSYAPVRDVLVSLVVPALARTLRDGATRDSALVAGDVDARVYGIAWRGAGAWNPSLGFFGGLKLPTAPIERDARGVPLPTELEPGCGSVVPYVGAVYAIHRGVWSGVATAALYLPFSVREQPHPGDSLRATAWLQLQPTRAFASRLGVSARVDGSGELTRGVADLNSGGFVGYVTSEILLAPATDFVLAVGAAFPVAQSLLGAHHEAPIASVRAAYDF